MNIDLRIILVLFLTCFILGGSTIWLVSRPHSKPNHPVTAAYPTGKPEKSQLGNQYAPKPITARSFEAVQAPNNYSAEPKNDKESEFLIHLVNTQKRAPNVYQMKEIELTGFERREYTASFRIKGKDVKPFTTNVSITPDWVSVASFPAGTYDWTDMSFRFVPRASSVVFRVVSEDVGEVWLKDLKIEAVK